MTEKETAQASISQARDLLLEASDVAEQVAAGGLGLAEAQEELARRRAKAAKARRLADFIAADKDDVAAGRMTQQ